MSCPRGAFWKLRSVRSKRPGRSKTLKQRCVDNAKSIRSTCKNSADASRLFSLLHYVTTSMLLFSTLKQFNRQLLRMIANWNHGQEALVVQARADYREVAGTLVDDEKQVFLRVKANRARRLADGDEQFAAVDGADDAAIVDVHGGEAVRGSVGDIEQAGVGAENRARWRITEHQVVAHFVGPGIDDLQAVRIGRDDVKLAAVGFQQH